MALASLKTDIANTQPNEFKGDEFIASLKCVTDLDAETLNWLFLI